MKISFKIGRIPRYSLKFDLKMKMSLLFLFVSLFQIQANESYAQRTKISLKLKKVSLERLFSEIENQSEFNFFYNIDDVDIKTNVTISVTQKKIFDVLDQVLKDTPIQYKVNGKQIILTKGKKKEKLESLLLQQHKVSGVVRDQNGLPIPGVTVLIETSMQGTTTNLAGKYVIKVPTNATLVFSSIGFKTHKERVNNRQEIDIQLEEDLRILEEVVLNAGYYNTTERERTGNITKVTTEEIEKQPITSPLESLQGRMSGVKIVQKSGIPGAAPSIQIRGQNSLRNNFYDNGNQPLYIIDGVPIISNAIYSLNYTLQTSMIDPLSGINLSNIESIEVLKDADATAIYGSRGANGVVLITTKKGGSTQNKTTVEVRFNTGVGLMPNKVDLVSTERYLELRKAGFENAGMTPTERNAADLLIWDQSRYTDWQEKLLGGSATSTNIDLSVSGGNETTRYRLNGSYLSQGTVFPGDNRFNKSTVGFNLNHLSSNGKFQLSFSSNYGITNHNFFSSTNFTSLAFSLPPNAPPIYNEDGSLNWEDSTWKNPYASLNSKSDNRGKNLIANTTLTYRLLHGITLKTNLGYSFLNSEDVVTRPRSVYDPAIWDRIPHRSSYSTIERNTWIIEPQIQIDNSWGNSNLNAIVGITFQQNENSSMIMSASGYANENLIGNLQAADIVTVDDNEKIKYKYSAIFARLGYNWNRKYFLNLTGRRDGSSRFGPNNRFANFGAIGAAWIFSEENFVKSAMPFLSFGKLRGSYGLTGSDQIGDYRYLDAYKATPGPNGLYPVQLTNPNFSWETNKKLEAAVELGFLNNRVKTNFSWYRNRSSNQLVGYALPAMTGFTQVEANLPATVQNTGLEIELSSINFSNKKFRWETSLNISFPKNKLISFPGIENSSYSYMYQVGHPLNIRKLFQYEGVDPETGLYVVTDVNDDGVYNYDDRIILKDIGRKYYGGIQNQITYNNFSFGFLIEFVKQDGNLFYDTRLGGLGNYLDDPRPIWQDIGDDAYFQKPSVGIDALFADYYFGSSEGAVVDASFIRFKTATLNYSLPQSMISRWGLTSFELFFHAQNLFTITSYIGLDPQNPGGRSLPALQSFTGGVQLNF